MISFELGSFIVEGVHMTLEYVIFWCVITNTEKTKEKRLCNAKSEQ